MPSNTKHAGPHDDCLKEGLHEHVVGYSTVARKRQDERARIFTKSEEYAALRMAQLPSTEHDEMIHDALMAAYQAGAMGQTEGLSIQDAINRLED